MAGRKVDSDQPDLAFDGSFEVESGLSDRDRAILIFERQWWKAPGAKEAKIWQQFGLSPARYYQVLGALIELPEALEFDPMLVRRLRRIRTSASRARFSRRLGADLS